MGLLMQLKHHVHFFCPDEIVWPELHNWSGTRIDDQTLSDRSGGILHSWVLRTYYQLRLAGETVTLSSSLRRDAINIVSVRDFGRKQRDPLAFLVIPQGDAHHSQLANFRILQNGVRPPDENASVIWHWPQPGIIPRDPSRGDRFETLCFKGRLNNLDDSLKSESFTTELEKLGVFFDVDAYLGLRGEHNWNNYSDADAVLALRNLTHYDAAKKPASKLVNAWFADTPALLGPEPAYRELGTPGEDYLEIRSASDALQAITALRGNPSLFWKIVENGRRLRENYADAALTKLWIETLNGPVSDAFGRWQSYPAWQKIMKTIPGLLAEKQAKQKDRMSYINGSRLLEDTTTRETSP